MSNNNLNQELFPGSLRPPRLCATLRINNGLVQTGNPFNPQASWRQIGNSYPGLNGYQQQYQQHQLQQHHQFQQQRRQQQHRSYLGQLLQPSQTITSSTAASSNHLATNLIIDNNINKNILSTWQQQQLESCFNNNNHYPTKELRGQLSTRLGISENKLQIWFQNRRAKQRRMEHTKKRPGRPSLANPPKNCSGSPISDFVHPSAKKRRVDSEVAPTSCDDDRNHNHQDDDGADDSSCSRNIGIDNRNQNIDVEDAQSTERIESNRNGFESRNDDNNNSNMLDRCQGNIYSNVDRFNDVNKDDDVAISNNQETTNMLRIKSEPVDDCAEGSTNQNNDLNNFSNNNIYNNIHFNNIPTFGNFNYYNIYNNNLYRQHYNVINNLNYINNTTNNNINNSDHNNINITNNNPCTRPFKQEPLDEYFDKITNNINNSDNVNNDDINIKTEYHSNITDTHTVNSTTHETCNITNNNNDTDEEVDILNDQTTTSPQHDTITPHNKYRYSSIHSNTSQHDSCIGTCNTTSTDKSSVRRMEHSRNDSGIYTGSSSIKSRKRKSSESDEKETSIINVEPKKKLNFSISSILGDL